MKGLSPLSVNRFALLSASNVAVPVLGAISLVYSTAYGNRWVNTGRIG